LELPASARSRRAAPSPRRTARAPERIRAPPRVLGKVVQEMPIEVKLRITSRREVCVVAGGAEAGVDHHSSRDSPHPRIMALRNTIICTGLRIIAAVNPPSD